MSSPTSKPLNLLEALEACRPGSDDIADPALAAAAAALAANPRLDDRFERQQKLDVALAGAVADVPVPDDLLPRLLAAVETAAHAPPAIPAAAGPAPSFPRRAALSAWWFGVAGAVAAGLLLAVWLAPGPRQDQFSAQALLEQAIYQFLRDADAARQAVDDVKPPRAFPPSSAVAAQAVVGWRAVSALLDRSGVAYDLAGRRGARATLFVLRGGLVNAPSEPPSRPAHETGNCSAALWQQNGLLYVLVVRGDARAYAELVDLPRGPVT